MLIVGLTGGIASGKSVVANMFRELGALVIDADEISKEVMVPHSLCWNKVVSFFGTEIVRNDLTIDRKMLASRVFKNPELLSQLNAIVHPVVIEEIERRIGAIRVTKPHAIVIIDAPLLIETAFYTRCNKVILVHASEEIQLQRLITRDALTWEEALARIHSQMPLSEKVKVADYVLSNEGSLSDTRKKVVELFNQLLTFTTSSE